MIKPIYILGAGGHARVLVEALRHNPNNQIAGFLEIDSRLIGAMVSGMPVYSQDVILNQLLPSDIVLVNGFGSVDIPKLRQQQFEKLEKNGFAFLSVKHKTAYCASDVVLQKGVQLLARSTILTGSKIGSNAIINTSASIDHDCILGSHVHIAPGAILSGGVQIEDACHI